MPKYIDADALCKKLEKYVPDGWDEYNAGFTTMQGNAMSEVEFSPAADVAPVVHCCQCKHDGECAIKLMIVSENGNNPYCSLGKRRGEDNV